MGAQAQSWEDASGKHLTQQENIHPHLDGDEGHQKESEGCINIWSFLIPDCGSFWSRSRKSKLSSDSINIKSSKSGGSSVGNVSAHNTASTTASSSQNRQTEQSIESDSSGKSDTTESSSAASVISKAEDELVASSHLRRFCFTDLKLATRNFRPDSILGEGGFGRVFKGWIDEHGTAPVRPGTGLTVAVKTLNHHGLQGHKEWVSEVTFLGQLHHPNLVKLIGFCIEDDHRLLVYEFMQRGSLENHLFRKGASPLPWNTRMKVALGAAKGVEFLHSGKKPVIYRDLKTSNILLDADYEAKLSDFGLARDGPHGDKSHVSTRVMGTYGYAAPEYVMTGHLSSKSDVYSFGVVLLELFTGKRSMDKTRPNGQHHLAEWARPYVSDRRKMLSIIDPRLDGHYSIKGAQRAGHLAYKCVSRDPKMRPSMTDVVQVLSQIQNLNDTVIETYSTEGSAYFRSASGH